MSLNGSVEDLPLLEILQVISYCQKTGHLTVRAPEGDAGVVFREGRVVSGYIWGTRRNGSAAPPGGGEQQTRERLAAILEQLVRLREGEFAFNLCDTVPTRLGDRDLSGEILSDGINPEELMLGLARKLDEDRRDSAATLEATFSAAEPAEEPQPAPAKRPAQPAEARVLLVDDEPEVCRVVGRQLADAGFEVVTAGSAAHARRELQRLAAGRQPFLLVADLGLPSESGASFRGGLDVVRHAAELASPPPSLLMTEAVDEKLRARARRLGVSLLAFKPGLSKLDPLQYQADLRAFGDKLARDLLPRLAGRPRATRPPAEAPLPRGADEAARVAALRSMIEEIAVHPDPDGVALLLLRAGRTFFARVLLFVVKDDRLRGLSGAGPVAGEAGSLDLLARGLELPLDEPSPLSEAVASGRGWTGPLPETGPLAGLLETIGLFSARFAAVVPLRVAHQPVALLYADAPDGSPMPPLEPFAEFVEQAGRALEGALAARRTPQPVSC